MKKQPITAPETKDSTRKANFAAFPLIAAFALPDLFVFPRILIFVLIPIVVCEFIVIGYYSTKVKNKGKLTELALQAASAPPKPKATIVGKGEVIGDLLQFSVAKGIRKKRWIVVKAIPVFEISSIESAENELTVTCNGVTAAFATKEKTGSFRELREEVQGIQDFQRKILEEQAKADARKSDLTGVINASIPIIDLSFSILVGLQEKRVNWTRLDGYPSRLGENLSFPAQTIPPLNLDFSKVSLAIKNQGAKETSKEAYEILKSIDGYFVSLKFNDGIEGALPKCQDTKNVIAAYYLLNDLLLGKVVGDRENKKENTYLETLLQSLSKQINFNVNFENLKETIDSLGFEADRESVIEDSREIFKEQLKNIDLLSDHFSAALPPTEQPMVVQPEYLSPPEPQEPTPPESTQPPIQQPTIEQQQEVVETTAIQQPEPTEPPKPQEPMQPPTESPVIDQQEPAQSSPDQSETDQPAIEEPEPKQAENSPENETTTESHEPSPKKKGLGRRLRKSIMGY